MSAVDESCDAVVGVNPPAGDHAGASALSCARAFRPATKPAMASATSAAERPTLASLLASVRKSSPDGEMLEEGAAFSAANSDTITHTGNAMTFQSMSEA